MPIKDLTGQKFGRLLVLERVEKVKGQKPHWICKCDCGNIKSVRGNILGRNTNSCGCLKKEQDKKNYGNQGICTKEDYIWQ